MGKRFAELHCHLGGSTPLRVLKKYLPEEQYEKLLSIKERVSHSRSLTEFLSGYFRLVESVQHTTDILCESAYAAMVDFCESVQGGDNVFELRFCPFYRNLPVLDQIEAIRHGLKMAEDQFGGVGKILLIAERGNYVHLNRLIDYMHVVDGVDVAGMENGVERLLPWRVAVTEVYNKARYHDLTTTYHVGEGDVQDVIAILKSAAPINRIGHGVALRTMLFDDIMRIADGRFFELCPSVNEMSGVATSQDVYQLARSFMRGGIQFGWFSDNPALTGISFSEQLSRVPDDICQYGTDCTDELVKVIYH